MKATVSRSLKKSSVLEMAFWPATLRNWMAVNMVTMRKDRAELIIRQCGSSVVKWIRCLLARGLANVNLMSKPVHGCLEGIIELDAWSLL